MTGVKPRPDPLQLIFEIEDLRARAEDGDYGMAAFFLRCAGIAVKTHAGDKEEVSDGPNETESREV